MIEIQHINKKYGDRYAVKDLSFHAEKGKVYGLLGANGAGKTTTLSILTGCLAPDSGTVKIGGFDILEQPDEAKRLMGYLPEVPPLYPDMTPLEFLSFVCDAKGIRKEEKEKSLQQVIKACSLREVLHRLCQNLSKGYKQRVGLAAALLGEPEILVLDEPMVGLDPMQIIEIRDLIREYGKNHTVIISSHILSEMDLICDRVLILSHGKQVAENTPDALSERFTDQHTLQLQIKGNEKAVSEVLASFGASAAWSLQQEEDRVAVSLSSAADLREPLFFAFAEKRLPILEMSGKSVSLEDVFLELSGDSDSAEGGNEA